MASSFDDNGGKLMLQLGGYAAASAVLVLGMVNARGAALSAFEISHPRAYTSELHPLVKKMEYSLTSPR